jgi:hypothetical protein
MRGSRVVYDGVLGTLAGKKGIITSMQRVPRCVVRFDYDRRERVVDIRNLTPEGAYPMSRITNFKTTVQTAIVALLKPLDADSAKEQAVRKLGVAAELVRLGEADKKRAKTELTKLGIITGEPQTGVVFDSPRYVVTATTKAASTRLDQSALEAALTKEGLSGAMRQRILAASMVENKAPVSFSVETK